MKDKELEKAMLAFNKKYGQNSALVLGGEEAAKIEIPVYPMGSYALDMACGGGLPLGRVIEIFGPQSAGKTTVALLCAANIQKAFPESYVAMSDTEHALDIPLAIKYGIDFDRMILNQPNTAEEGIDFLEAMIRTGKVRLALFDSVAAMEPKAEAEADMDQQSMALTARIMSKALRKLTPVCAEFNCTIIFINQIREKVGVMFGNPEVTPGGRALAFHSSLRLKVSAGEPIKDDKKEQIGHVLNVKVVKNKIARPFKTASFNLLYGIGVDPVAELTSLAITVDVIHKAGGWFSYTTAADEEIKIQGEDNMAGILRERPDICAEIEKKIRGGAV